MRELLLEIKKRVDERKVIADELDKQEVETFQMRYSKIIEKGIASNPSSVLHDRPKKRGRKKQSEKSFGSVKGERAGNISLYV